MLTTTPHGLPNDRGRVLGPHEGRGMTVPLRDVRVDVTHERADGLERRTANGLAREDTEPRLDHVQPGCAFRGEVKLNLRMLGEPGLHGWRRMRRGVVEHDVQAASAIAARRRFMKPKKSAPVCCAAQLPVTRPLATSRAAYRLVS